MKKIIICADDYAQNEPISNAILDLVKTNRLSAVSCMTFSDHWHAHGKKLLAVSNNIDLGLHFDITHFNTINSLSFPKLILASCLNKIDLDIIEKSLNAQLDAFETVMGRAPDFVDGHQHIHILPNIRVCILNSLKLRYRDDLPYLRQVNPNILGSVAPIKALVLRVLAMGFKSLATKRGFQLSKHFFGIYSLKPVQYSSIFKNWLSQAVDCSLIMCHPGYSSTDLYDPIRNARIVEFNYLASEQFSQDLLKNNVQISRWKTAY